MLVRYKSHTIYHVYLIDKKKVCCIKNLKIVENADKKADSQLNFYNAIIKLQDDFINNIFILFFHIQHSFYFFHTTKPCFRKQKKNWQLTRWPY